jgi:uncharacterized damage-inducible protein DinB
VPYDAERRGEKSMDEAIQLVIDMSDTTWNAFKAELKDLTPDEINWRPLPQANNIAVLIKHLRVVEELFLAQLAQGEQSAYKDVPNVQKLTSSVPLNYEENLKEFEELHNRFLNYLKHTTLADLKHQTFVTPFAQGSRPANALLFSEIGHLTLHRGQIRTIRNLYRKTRGEQSLFAPQNPTFGE